MNAHNLVVLRGVVTSEPRVRELPSGATVTNLEVTTRGGGRTASVPVSVLDRKIGVTAGAEVVVTGHVGRRFFRVGGVTQSRTEVVAHRVVAASRRRAAERAVAEVVTLLAG
jgi:single-strand DNA-binding protein